MGILRERVLVFVDRKCWVYEVLIGLLESIDETAQWCGSSILL